MIFYPKTFIFSKIFISKIFISKYFKYLFQLQSCEEKGKQEEFPSTGSLPRWVHPGWARMKPGALPGSPTWLTGAQALGPSCAASGRISRKLAWM